MAEKRFLTLKEVIAKVRLQKSTIYKYMRTGEFPQNIKVTPKAVRWDADAIEKWMLEKLKPNEKDAHFLQNGGTR